MSDQEDFPKRTAKMKTNIRVARNLVTIKGTQISKMVQRSESWGGHELKKVFSSDRSHQ